jgi:hypothetical protein
MKWVGSEPMDQNNGLVWTSIRNTFWFFQYEYYKARVFMLLSILLILDKYWQEL